MPQHLIALETADPHLRPSFVDLRLSDLRPCVPVSAHAERALTGECDVVRPETFDEALDARLGFFHEVLHLQTFNVEQRTVQDFGGGTETELDTWGFVLLEENGVQRRGDNNLRKRKSCSNETASLPFRLDKLGFARGFYDEPLIPRHQSRAATVRHFRQSTHGCFTSGSRRCRSRQAQRSMTGHRSPVRAQGCYPWEGFSSSSCASCTPVSSENEGAGCDGRASPCCPCRSGRGPCRPCRTDCFCTDHDHDGHDHRNGRCAHPCHPRNRCPDHDDACAPCTRPEWAHEGGQ